jgi:predicted membrane channel-forming protein YqfA (hemolysin III family)
MSTKKLFTYQEIPERLKRNPYVLGSYRMNLTLQECISSLFSIHNETLNIWTHLFGFILFLFFSIYTSYVFYMNSKYVNIGDIVCWIVFLLAVENLYLSSTLYHWIGLAHKEERVYRVCYCMDISAIGGIICGSFFPGYYYW